MGVCQLSPDCQHRRIDILFLSLDQYYCGSLCFTGSAFFNRLMRTRANEMAFILNEYSLRKLGDWNSRRTDSYQFWKRDFRIH